MIRSPSTRKPDHLHLLADTLGNAGCFFSVRSHKEKPRILRRRCGQASPLRTAAQGGHDLEQRHRLPDGQTVVDGLEMVGIDDQRGAGLVPGASIRTPRKLSRLSMPVMSSWRAFSTDADAPLQAGRNARDRSHGPPELLVLPERCGHSPARR